MGLLSLEYFKLSEFFKILYPDVWPTTPNPVYVLMMYVQTGERAIFLKRS
jgi:hypothetical protein